MTVRFEHRLCGLAVLSLLAGGCARAAGSPATPRYAAPPPPAPGERGEQRLAELERTLSESEGELRAALPPPPAPAAPAPAEPSWDTAEEAEGDAKRSADEDRAAASSSAPPASPPRATTAAAEQPPPARRAGREEPPCAVACRALDSMSRAADRICSITGEGAASCVDARERVAAARERIAGAGCGCGR